MRSELRANKLSNRREKASRKVQTDLNGRDRISRRSGCLRFARLILPLGWAMSAVGYYGPWIAHPTAALALTGVDMGEFVKFLPQVLDGTLRVTRFLFYLPPLAVVVSVAVFALSPRLEYPWILRLLAYALAVLMSLQLLPPAWSPSNLLTVEFRLQTIALLAAWFLLASSWLWGRRSTWFVVLLGGVLSLAASGLSTWQFWLVKPAIDLVYGLPPSVGWGFFLCIAGLMATALGSFMAQPHFSEQDREL